MIPILYEAHVTDFSSNGLGGLSDIISGTVSEERNGMYELEMVYPLDGQLYDEIQIDRIIKAKPNDTAKPQAFRIYFISKPIDGKITINAEHVSYQLLHIPIMPCEASTVQEAFSALATHSAVDNPFSFWTNKVSGIEFKVLAPTACRNLLGGVEGSILDLAGSGEYEFDNFDVKFYTARGADNGVVIKYGKNLIDLKQEESIEDCITGVAPYWSKDDNTVTLADKVVTVDSVFTYPRIVPLDVSSQFEVAPTDEQLKTAATQYLKTVQTVPKINLNVDFVALGDTLDYPDLKDLERVSLCDTVTVQFERLGVDATAKVIKTVYDFVKEKYEAIEIGDAKSRFADSITQSAGIQQQISDRISTLSNEIANVIANQTKLITGASDSYVYIDMENVGNERILFMDNPDKTLAKNVLQINKNGIGFSQTGINGDYTKAWTLDGTFNTNFITAEVIKGLKFESESAVITGGSINIYTATQDDSLIALRHEKCSTFMAPSGLWFYQKGKLVCVMTPMHPSGGVFLNNPKGKIYSATIECANISANNNTIRLQNDDDGHGILQLKNSSGELMVSAQGSDGNIWCQDIYINGVSVKNALGI